MRTTYTALAAAAFAFVLAAPAARVQAQTAPAPAGFKAEIIRNLEEVEKKLVALAERFPQDKYGWHPEGARSTSEVFMHIAAGNYTYSTFFGTPRPESTTGPALAKITDKGKVVETLKNSFTHIETAIQNAPDLDKTIKLFGRDATVREAMLVAAAHTHEHLGQLIAYARVNGIVPPWSEHPAPARPAKP
jgi:uncharacterized damage-inducible protein DinB